MEWIRINEIFPTIVTGSQGVRSFSSTTIKCSAIFREKDTNRLSWKQFNIGRTSFIKLFNDIQKSTRRIYLCYNSRITREVDEEEWEGIKIIEKLKNRAVKRPMKIQLIMVKNHKIYVSYDDVIIRVQNNI